MPQFNQKSQKNKPVVTEKEVKNRKTRNVVKKTVAKKIDSKKNLKEKTLSPKKTVAKRSLTKKAVEPKKTFAKKSLMKKSVEAESIDSKKEKLSGLAKSDNNAIVSKSKNISKSVISNDIITLPNNTPLRLKEKSILLRHLFDREVVDAFYKIAYTSGFCFLLVGLSLLMSDSLDTFRIFNLQQTATIASSTDEGTTTTQTDENLTAPESTVDETQAEVGETEFQFLTSIPSNIPDPLEIKFMVTNVTNISSKIKPINQIGFIDVPFENISTDKYRTKIPADNLSLGYYELRIYVKPQNGDPAKSFASPKFFNGTEEEEKIYLQLISSQKEPEDDSSVTVEKETETTNSETESTKEETQTTEVKDEPIEQTEPEPIKQTETEKVVEETKSDTLNPEKEPPIELLFSHSTLSEMVILSAKNAEKVDFLELYYRPVSSTNQRFITLATKRSGVWQFVFDSRNIPNGEFEFFAQTMVGGKRVTSKVIKLKVYNDLAIKPRVIETREETKDVITVYESEKVETNTNSLRPIETADIIRKEVTMIMQNNSQEFSDLIKRYAIAYHTGDDVLVQSVDDLIDKKRMEIKLELQDNLRKRDIANDVYVEIGLRIENLKLRAIAFEANRLNISSADKSPDTSNLEIPRVLSSEQSEVFESPKETFGLVRDDVFTIEQVLPIVVQNNDNQEEVKMEIKGRGLPNSVVTLYIFSFPTVVTIKTDADGSFAYTFDKELEDGRHDVYVAMTDETGIILAQSNPFSFIKEAQAFTPVDAARANTITSETVLSPETKNYNSVIGMGILALGLILVILGLGLRGNKDEELIQA